MKRNLLNFTRGSQLLGHFGFMFAAGLKGPLLVTFLVSAWLCYLEVTSALSDHQMYLAWMHVYASGYAFMEFDPGKLVELKLAGGGTVRMLSASSLHPTTAATDGTPAANDDGAGKPVVPEQLKLDLRRTSGAPKEAGHLAEEQFSGRPAQLLQSLPQQGEAGTSPEQLVGSGAAATLPPAPLLSGRSEASDEAQPSPDERASGRGNQPASSDPKAIPAVRSQESPSPRERAERDLLEGGVESGAQDFYEPDL